MVVIVCGDRNWDDEATMLRVLSYINPDVIIEGECRGADIMAREIGERNGVTVIRCPADWDTHGKAAGPIRNKQMLDILVAHPDPQKAVLAFHNDYKNSRGTKNMCRQAGALGYPVGIHTTGGDGLWLTFPHL